MSRRQKRTTAANTGASPVQSEEDILLTRSVKSKEEHHRPKTLLEVAAAQQEALDDRARSYMSNSNSRGTDDDDDDDESQQAPIHPVLDTLFLAFPLSCVNFTLSVLTAHQYAQTLSLRPLMLQTICWHFPFLFFLIHCCHGHLKPQLLKGRGNLSPFLSQLGYLIGANLSGCYLIQLTNDGGYYAVMKRAPPVGTLWVWTVLELGLVGALGGVIGPALYAWYGGYGFY